MPKLNVLKDWSIFILLYTAVCYYYTTTKILRLYINNNNFHIQFTKFYIGQNNELLIDVTNNDKASYVEHILIVHI